MEIIQQIALYVIQIAVMMGFVLFNAAYLTYAERRLVGRMQLRFGPNRVGPFGLLQPLADGIKLFFKEDITPAKADRGLFLFAPLLSLVTVLVAFAVLPFGKGLWIADLNIALLYLLALSSLTAYGIIVAGWASNSKYALLGGLRSTAQVISYEVAMGLSLVPVLMLSGSLSLVEIVEAQSGYWFLLVQPVAFFIFLVSAVAETNRAPFDLPEAESELVGGFHTEYSGMRFAFFFIAEYAAMLVVSSLAAILFMGGWHPLPVHIPGLSDWLGQVPSPLWFLAKVYLFLFLFIWVRATLPRLRYDQLMALGWKVFLPVSLANILLTGLGIVLWPYVLGWWG